MKVFPLWIAYATSIASVYAGPVPQGVLPALDSECRASVGGGVFSPGIVRDEDSHKTRCIGLSLGPKWYISGMNSKFCFIFLI